MTTIDETDLVELADQPARKDRRAAAVERRTPESPADGLLDLLAGLEGAVPPR